MKIYNSAGIEILDIEVNDTSYMYKAIQEIGSLTLYFSYTSFIEIPIGAYCTFQAENYYLTDPANFKKNGTRNFEYTLILESIFSNAKRYKIRNIQDGRLKFSLTAKPQDHLKLIVDNMNLRDAGWSVGNYIDATEKVLNYNHVYAIDALKMIAEEFNTEWEVVGKTIHLKKVEYYKDNPLALSYGKGNGFRPGLGRMNLNDSRPVELLYVQGGEQNIDFSKYNSKELLLPKSQQLVYNGRTYESDAAGLYIKRADKEVQFHNEDSIDLSHIYPSRVGTISSVVVVDEGNHFYDIIDASIPADLNFNDCRIAGEKAIIVFQTGMLAGREFDIEQTDNALTGYIHAERRFKLVPQEIDGVVMPDSTFAPAVGDKYAVFNISLPDAYVCDNATKQGASWDMFREAAKYLNENEDQKFSFTGELDGIWAKQNWLTIGGKIKPGGYVSFSDTQFQTEGVLVRMTSVKQLVNNPYSPVIELSNTPAGGGLGTTLKKIDANEVVTDRLIKETVRYAKRGFRDSKQTAELLANAMKHYSEAISPVSVQTMSLLLGDESLQFRFVDDMLTPAEVSHTVQYNPVTKVLNSPAGIIQHMTLGIDSISSSRTPAQYKFWNVPVYNSAALVDPNKSYYLYAKVSKTNQLGSFLLNETPIGMEDVAGYYHLLVGILNSENDEGDRSYVDFYGYTELLPGRITTNKIVSPGGNIVIDLANDACELQGSFKFSSGKTDAEIENDISTAITAAVGKSYAAGEMLYTDASFKNGLNGVVKYDQNNNANLTVTRINKGAIVSPITDSDYLIEIKAVGTGMYPGLGGFYFFNNASRSGAIFILRFIAKVPVDYTLNWTTNSIGDGHSYYWSTKNNGTGNFEEYIVVAKCGITGTFNSTNYIYVTGPNPTAGNPLIWYLAWASVFDMTSSDNAFSAAINAQSAANAAKNIADTALDEITNITSDNILSAAEKPSQRKEWNVIYAEKSGLNTLADDFEITTEKAAYDTAFQTLATYLNGDTTWSNGVPSWLADENLSTNTAIEGSTFRTKWGNFYAARIILLNAISTKAKAIADAAQIQANTAKTDAATAQRLAFGKSYMAGKMLRTDPSFVSGYNGISKYDNLNSVNLSVTRINKGSIISPITDSDYVLEIKAVGTGMFPGLGGFYFNNASRSGAIFILRFIAKVPVGYTLNWTTNSVGDGYSYYWATGNIGTGNFEEYIVVVKCGITGTFAGTNYIYATGLNPTAGNPLIWYLAWASVFDMTLTDNPYSKALAAETAAIAASQASEYLREAIQNDTTVSGGLLATTLMKVGAKNQSGQWVEKAGINGAGTGDNTPRIYAGGTLQQALQRIAGDVTNGAKTVITEGGKIFGRDVELFGSIATAPSGERIVIDQVSKSIIIYDATGPKTVITSGAIPSLASLLAGNSSSVAATVAISIAATGTTLYDDETQYSATLTLPSSSNNYTVTTPPIACSCSAASTNGTEAMADVSAFLVRPDGSKVALGALSVSVSGLSGDTSDTSTITIPSQQFSSMPSGNYKIELNAVVSKFAGSGNNANASISIAAPNNILSGESVVNVSRIFKDGMFIISDATNYTYISPTTFEDNKGGNKVRHTSTEKSFGVLAAAKVSSGGVVTNLIKTITASAAGSGLYTITHNLGNTNYNVQITPESTSNASASVESISSNSCQVRLRSGGTGTNMNFHISIMG